MQINLHNPNIFCNFARRKRKHMEGNNDNIVVRYDLPKNWSEEKYFS